MQNRFISIEREFSVRKNGKSATNSETKKLLEKLKPQYEMMLLQDLGLAVMPRNRNDLKIDFRNEMIRNQSIVDFEVAENGGEIKGPFLEPALIEAYFRASHELVERIAKELNLEIRWTSQPQFELASFEKNNKFFTTLTFPELVPYYVLANSLHIHLESTEENAIHLYKTMNAIAPWFVLNSRKKSDIDSLDRLSFVKRSIEVMGELYLPQDLNSLTDFEAYVKSVSQTVEERMKRLGRYEEIKDKYPKFFSSGRLILSPDKIFNPARLRPDLRLPNGNLSIEFRAIDGMQSKFDSQMVSLAVFLATKKETISSIEEIRSFYMNPTEVHPAYKKANEFIRDTISTDRMGEDYAID